MISKIFFSQCFFVWKCRLWSVNPLRSIRSFTWELKPSKRSNLKVRIIRKIKKETRKTRKIIKVIESTRCFVYNFKFILYPSKKKRKRNELFIIQRNSFATIAKSRSLLPCKLSSIIATFRPILVFRSLCKYFHQFSRNFLNLRRSVCFITRRGFWPLFLDLPSLIQRIQNSSFPIAVWKLPLCANLLDRISKIGGFFVLGALFTRSLPQWFSHVFVQFTPLQFYLPPRMLQSSDFV